MKIDRRKGKRILPAYCNSPHEFGDFIPVGNDLKKRCKHCPATLAKAEYLKLGTVPDFGVRREVKDVCHIDLFVF